MITKEVLICFVIIAIQGLELKRSLHKRGLPDGAVVDKCPPEWKDSHCSCDINYLSLSTTITCHDVNGIDQLKKSLTFTWKNRAFEWLVLQNVNVESFPKDTLNDMSFIGFIFQNVTIQNLDSKAFEGSRNIAQYIWASDSNLTNFNFDVLKPLRKLQSIVIMTSHLKKINSDAFHGLLRLEDINLERNELTKIGINAFSSLPQLHRLDLSGNNLTSLEKGILNTTGSLRDVVMVLSDNQISEISSDAFDGVKTMNINMERNRLRTLNKEAFSQLLNEMTKFGRGKLSVKDNPFDCNKSFDWLTENPEYLERIVGFPCTKKNGSNSGP